MQKPNQSSNHFHRTQNPKDKRAGEGDCSRSEDRASEHNPAIAPMSTEMKEVLAGLARFDLLPENRQKPEELILPVITAKKQPGCRRPLQIPRMNEKDDFSYTNKTHGSRNLESFSRFSGNNESYLPRSSSNSMTKPRILIDEIDDNESMLKPGERLREPPQRRSGRFRSVTYPKPQVNYSENEESLSKIQSHLLLSRKKMTNSFEQNSGVNELQSDSGTRRPRAATFPYYREFSPIEFSEDLSSASLRNHNSLSRNESRSTSDKKVYDISKPAGKTTSKDEMSSIVNRCEEWFRWRQNRRKMGKHRQ